MKHFYFCIIILLAQIILIPAKGQNPKKLRSTFSLGIPFEQCFSAEQCFSVQQSIGQSSVIGSYNAKKYQLRQGYIQPSSLNSISGQTKELKAVISPNPFTTSIKIQFTNNLSEDIFVNLFDVYGHTLYNGKFVAQQELTLDFNYLLPGFYIIKINTTRKYLTAKLIKE